MSAFFAGFGIAGVPLAILWVIERVRRSRAEKATTAIRFQLAEQRAATVAANANTDRVLGEYDAYRAHTEAENATTTEQLSEADALLRECGAAVPDAALERLRLAKARLQAQRAAAAGGDGARAVPD